MSDTTENVQISLDNAGNPQGFAAIEHKTAGDKAFAAVIERSELDGLRGELVRENILVPTEQGWWLNLFGQQDEPLDLSAGDWVALGGDFYGIPKAPISVSITNPMGNIELRRLSVKEGMPRFEQAYATLAGMVNQEGDNYDASKKKLKGIRDGIALEARVVKQAEDADDTTIFQALEGHADEANAIYGRASMSDKSRLERFLKRLPMGYLKSEYVALAQHNVDHFGERASVAYQAGHATALKTLDGVEKLGRQEQLDTLLKALTKELFACHFATDLFAAGHMRTPRLALIEHIYTWNQFYQHFDDHIQLALFAGFIAEQMHHVDNIDGLNVRSVHHPDGWLAQGDHCYFEQGQEDNSAQMQAMLEMALMSIIVRFRTLTEENFTPTTELERKAQSYQFDDYRPTVTDNNSRAMYTSHEIDGKPVVVKLRDTPDETQTDDVLKHYDADWSPIVAFFNSKPRSMAEATWQEYRDKFTNNVERAKQVISDTAALIEDCVGAGIDNVKQNCTIQ